MSTVKTKISPDLVHAYLIEHFNTSISELEFISGGESSQAFSFISEGESLIVRANKNELSFLKDRIAFERFAPRGILIPEILHVGSADGFSFAVSRRASGVIVKSLSEEELIETIPDLTSVLNHIHSIDISSAKGFGKWDSNQVGEYSSWQEFVLGVGKFVYQDNMFETTCLEREVWEKGYSELVRSAEYAPDEKYLVHGDYGFDNVIVQDGVVTGVLDWAESMYGDFVYDIAWLCFWGREKGYLFEKQYADREIPNFKERLLCYKLHIALSSLSFYAFSQQQDKYDRAKLRLLNLL